MFKSTMKEYAIILLTTLGLLIIAEGLTTLSGYLCSIIPMVSIQTRLANYCLAIFIIMFWMAFFKKKPYTSQMFQDWWAWRKLCKSDGEFIRIYSTKILKYMEAEMKLDSISEDKENIKKDVSVDNKGIVPTSNEMGKNLNTVLSHLAQRIKGINSKNELPANNKVDGE